MPNVPLHQDQSAATMQVRLGEVVCERKSALVFSLQLEKGEKRVNTVSRKYKKKGPSALISFFFFVVFCFSKSTANTTKQLIKKKKKTEARP